MYEYVIRCLECASHRAQGGFEQPAALRDADVLAKMTHNPGCRTGTYDPQKEAIQVVPSQEEEPGVTGYVISLVPREEQGGEEKQDA